MPPLRILCFGDSLTSGFFSFGQGSNPYAIQLEHRLSATLPSTPISVDTSGLPGDVASFEGFSKRFEKQLMPPRVYDWVIILGGTNDVGIRQPPQVIFEALQKCWDLAISKGAKVLALTVPETHTASARRDALNKLILSHKSPNFHVFDLHAKIPYQSLDEVSRQKYWDDGVHLTESGYDWMGNHIADAFLKIIAQDGAHGGWFEDAFTEEQGDPRRLEQGYIVIRKKDLD